MFPLSKLLAADEQRLVQLFSRLQPEDRHALLAFAAFLAERQEERASPEAEPDLPAQPLDIPRPEQETVVGALRRLRETYPMVDPDRLLDEASGLMSAHLLGGRPLEQVIDELEALFERHFHDMKKG